MTQCKNKLRELLPWYVNQTLSEDETKKVEAHLKECPDCRKELEEIKELSSDVKEVSEVLESPHIESEKLVIYLEEPEILTSDEKTAIEKHLQSCPVCYQELQTLRSANLELEALEKKEKTGFVKEVTFWDRLVAGLIWLVRKPAFAYIIVLLLAYPAVRWLFGPSQPSIYKVESEKIYMLSQQTRLPAKPTLVIPSKEDKTVRIGVVHWAEVENPSYDLKINDESGQTIYSIEDFTDFGSQGYFQLVLNTDSIPDGRYVLIVRETSQEDTTKSSETLFPFQIIKSKE